MEMVYILWCSDEDGSFIEGIFNDKTDAEKEMQAMMDMDKERGMEDDYFYTIQEREVK